jgi:hypothetical protein
MTSETVGATETPASLKDKHEFLITVLRDTYTGLLDFAFKHGTLLAIALGWLITSDNARDFLSQNAIAKYSICLAALLWTYFYYKWVGVFYNRSSDAYDRLKLLNFMPEDYVVLRVIPKSTRVTFVIFHAAMSILLCILALDIRIS